MRGIETGGCPTLLSILQMPAASRQPEARMPGTPAESPTQVQGPERCCCLSGCTLARSWIRSRQDQIQACQHVKQLLCFSVLNKVFNKLMINLLFVSFGLSGTFSTSTSLKKNNKTAKLTFVWALGPSQLNSDVFFL